MCSYQQKQIKINSAIYEGTVRHRRYLPKNHEFSYKVFMVYLDLQEMDSVFSQSPWWSCKHFSFAWFRRKDFFDGDSKTSLYDAVAKKVEDETGQRPKGPIRMLSNLRYFGFIINPITCYYCFDKTGQHVETVVAEVTNTPWKERCHYVLDFRRKLDGRQPLSQKQDTLFQKNMHVSPFQSMDLIYQWRGKTPSDQLFIHIDVLNSEKLLDHNQRGKPIFDATVMLKKQEITSSLLRQKIFSYPWMTAKVCLAIYWQALRLWIKKIPFYSHPTTPVITKNPIK